MLIPRLRSWVGHAGGGAVVSVLLTVALGVSILLGAPAAVRVALAVPVYLVAPGFLFLQALFPERDAPLTPLERFALAVPVSFVILSMGGLLLVALGARIHSGLAFVVLASLVMTLAFAVARRRRGLPADERAETVISRLGKLGPRSLMRARAGWTVALFPLVVAGVFGGILVEPSADDDAISIALLGPHGDLASLPAEVRVGQNVTVQVVVRSQGDHDFRRVEASLEPASGAGGNVSAWTVNLTEGAEWRRLIDVEPEGPGEHVLWARVVGGPRVFLPLLVHPDQ